MSPDRKQPSTGQRPPDRTPTRAWLALSLLALGGIALAWAVSVAWLHLAPVQRQIHQGKALVGGPFVLVSHTGLPISDADFRGRPMLVTFGYTRNPDLTSATLQVMSAVLGRLGRRADRIAAILITLDPAHDNPAKLKEYLANFDRRLIGATGSEEAVAAVAKAYRLPFQRNSGGDGSAEATIEYEPLIYLMNSKGEYVAHMTHDSSADAIMLAVEPLL